MPLFWYFPNGILTGANWVMKYFAENPWKSCSFDDRKWSHQTPLSKHLPHRRSSGGFFCDFLKKKKKKWPEKKLNCENIVGALWVKQNRKKSISETVKSSRLVPPIIKTYQTHWYRQAGDAFWTNIEANPTEEHSNNVTIESTCYCAFACVLLNFVVEPKVNAKAAIYAFIVCVVTHSLECTGNAVGFVPGNNANSKWLSR